jgi:hypothetical protein
LTWWDEVGVAIVGADTILRVLNTLGCVYVSTALILSMSVVPAFRILQYPILLLILLTFHRSRSTSAEFSGLHHEHLLQLVLQLFASVAEVWRHDQALVIESAVVDILPLSFLILSELVMIIAECKS